MAKPRPPPDHRRQRVRMAQPPPPRPAAGEGPEEGHEAELDIYGVCWLVLMEAKASRSPVVSEDPTPLNQLPLPARSHRRKRAARGRRQPENNESAVRGHYPFEGLLFPGGATVRAAAERRTRYPRLIVPVRLLSL